MPVAPDDGAEPPDAPEGGDEPAPRGRAKKPRKGAKKQPPAKQQGDKAGELWTPEKGAGGGKGKLWTPNG